MPREADANDIVTPRLLLRLLDHPFLDACLRGRVPEARVLLGTDVPQVWLAQVDFIARRWQQLQNEPEYAPFAPRALLRRTDLRMVGHVGFHTAPDPPYLFEHAAVRAALDASADGGAVIEIGYAVFADARRQGYAEEAVRGMAAWAAAAHGVRRVVASIAPDNQPSQRLAAKLGFVRIGSHIDEVDGPEDVLLWTLPP